MSTSIKIFIKTNLFSHSSMTGDYPVWLQLTPRCLDALKCNEFKLMFENSMSIMSLQCFLYIIFISLIFDYTYMSNTVIYLKCVLDYTK